LSQHGFFAPLLASFTIAIAGDILEQKGAFVCASCSASQDGFVGANADVLPFITVTLIAPALPSMASKASLLSAIRVPRRPSSQA